MVSLWEDYTDGETAKECLKDRPDTLIQENKTLAHTSPYQNEIYSLFEVQRLLWPGNSLDLNMIEPTWPYMKRKIT